MRELNLAVTGIINRTAHEGPGTVEMHIAEKFERLLDAYRQPDGRKWNGAELAKATGGVVHRSYVTNLRKGRIESPGFDKMRAIAEAMGFPPAMWFDESLSTGPDVGPDNDLKDALLDATVREAVREFSRLPDRERRMVLGIMRQLMEA